MKVSVTYDFDVPEEMVQTSIDKAVEREVESQIREEGLIRCKNCNNSIILNHGRIMCSKWAGSTIKEGYCFRAERKAKTVENNDK